MNGEALELPDGSFDVAVSMFGWFMFADRARGLSEMHRVLKPGGRVLVTSWSTPDRNTLLGNGMEALRAALPELPRPAKPPATQNPETCATEMRAAGFGDVTTTFSTHAVSFTSVDHYWDMLERGGAPMAVMRKKLGDENWHAATARAEAFLRERFGAGPVEVQAEAIATSGVRRL
jgi:SAM-dependent methyltransferase